MSSLNRLKRGGLALGVGAIALGAATAPALATTAPNITGSGSSLQRFAQDSAWLLNWAGDGTTTNPGLTALSPKPVFGTAASGTFYNPTSSGAGLAVFGNDDSTLNLPSAGDMDAFVGTDEPPNSAQAGRAFTASGNVREITIPVAQAPVAVLLSTPEGVTISTQPRLTSDQLLRLFTNGYSTWGEFLTDVRVTPTVADGASVDVPIKLQARSSESGTTFATIDYLDQLGATFDRSGEPTVWTTGGMNVATTQNNCSPAVLNNGGGDVVRAVIGVPGSVGYANLADAANGGFSPAVRFSGTPTNTTQGLCSNPVGNHSIVWVQLQNNPVGATTTFADPIANGRANVKPSSTGSWQNAPASITNTTTWERTTASNPHVGGERVGLSTVQRYPFVAATYVEAWESYSGASLSAAYPTNIAQTGAAARDYAQYLANGANGANGNSYLLTGGQTLIGTSSAGDARYYGAVPAAINTLARSAADLVNHP